MDERHSIGGNDFVWDDDKAARNHAKHGIRFHDAVTIFVDPLLVRFLDGSRIDGAIGAVIGLDSYARLLVVIYRRCDGDLIRIVAARPASSGEEKLHAQRITEGAAGDMK